MTSLSNGSGRPPAAPVRIAAAGDMHVHPPLADEARAAFAALAGEIDLLLLAGDLTTHGEPADRSTPPSGTASR